MSDPVKGAARVVPWGFLIFGVAAIILIGVAYRSFANDAASGTAEGATIIANASGAITQATYSIKQILAILGTVALTGIALAWLASNIRSGGGGGGH